MRHRFYEDYSHKLADNSFKKPFPQTKNENEKVNLKTTPTSTLKDTVELKLYAKLDPKSISYINRATTFRFREMTGKGKEKKSGDQGPQAGQGQGGQGQAPPQGSAPTAPPQPQSQAPGSTSQGQPPKPVSPTQPGSKKVEAAKGESKAEPKADKKSTGTPSLEKSVQDNKKVTLAGSHCQQGQD